MKILVADDSKTNLTLIASSLKNLGHEVVAANYGQEAIEIFQHSRPDLIILDVVMEGMNGYECAKRIRALSMGDWIPIIFLSGSVDDDSIAKGIDAGGDDYLTKPYSEITLAAKIKAMQRISAMRSDLFDAKEKLALLSSIDALTGIYNRMQFNKSFKEEIAHANRLQSQLALFFLDLDKFKRVNDNFGHHVGDLLLMAVVKRLQSCLRADDFLARIGGDEFALILSDIKDNEIVKTVAEKIISQLAVPFDLNGTKVSCGCSIGIVFYPDDGTDQEMLAKKADMAMYSAKRSGRNHYQYFNESLIEQKLVEGEALILKTVETNQSLVLNCLINSMMVCINLEFIKKILPLPQLQMMAGASKYLVGLMNLAGQSISVIDLGAIMHLERNKSYSLDAPILLCSNGFNALGFIVDKVLDLYDINQQNITKTNYIDHHFLLGSVAINNELSLLIDMKKLLSMNFNSEYDE